MEAVRKRAFTVWLKEKVGSLFTFNGCLLSNFLVGSYKSLNERGRYWNCSLALSWSYIGILICHSDEENQVAARENVFNRLGLFKWCYEILVIEWRRGVKWLVNAWGTYKELKKIVVNWRQGRWWFGCRIWLKTMKRTTRFLRVGRVKVIEKSTLGMVR